MDEIRVGLLGFGTVGAGVVKCLTANADLIAARTGVKPILARVADLDIETDRGVEIDPAILGTDADAVIDDPDIDVIVELVGGCTVAKDFVLKALRGGKPVVTANKALLAHHGAEIFAAAEAGNADIFYEASVAGGIPIIKSLREGLAGNHIQTIYGILNGTCNYILTRMENEGLAFDDILAQAQELGYAEAEPSLDIDGIDTAHKTAILASLAYGEWFGMEALPTEGIRGIDPQDIRNAAEAGYRLKLLGIIKLAEAGIEMRVNPALIPADSLLANVNDVFNAVFVRGDVVGDTMFYGRGAGMDATASAVVGDLVDVALNLKVGAPRRVSAFRPHGSYSDVTPLADMLCRYYLRLQVSDRPNVLAGIARILGAAGISLASVVQKETVGDSASIILITHEAKEGSLRQALDEIEQLDTVQAKPVMIRIEDL